MYKKQMTLQKIVCLLAILASALVFIYSLGIMTDLYDSLYGTMRDPNDLTKTTVDGSIIYYDMQEFNNAFLKGSIGLILLSCLLFVTNTHVRRKYYIGNYVSTALMTIGNLAMVIWAHGQIEMYKAQFLQIDFEALAKHAKRGKTLYTESTFWFDVHYAVFGVVLVITVLLIANAVWKTILMKQEKALIEAGKGA